MVISNSNISKLNCGLTVIVPTHNRHAHLAKTLASLVKMPEINVVVVVDDGSTIPVQVDHPKVKLIRNPLSLGEGRAINQGLPFVQTKFLAIISDDDPQGDDWLPEIFAAIKRKPGYICYYPSNIFIASDQETKRIFAVKYNQWEVYLFEFMPCLAGVIMDYELIRSHGINELRSSVEFPNDFLQWMQLSMIGKFRPVPRSFARWQIHPEQTSSTLSSQNKSLQYLNNLISWKNLNLVYFKGLGFSVSVIRFLQMSIPRNMSRRSEIKDSYREVIKILPNYPGKKIFLIFNLLLALVFLVARKIISVIKRRSSGFYLILLAKNRRAGAKYL